jgi:hypothetical protein
LFILVLSSPLLSSIAASTSMSSQTPTRTRRGPGTANEIGQQLMAHSCNTPAVAIALARRLLAGYSQAIHRLPAGLTLAAKPPMPSPNMHMGPVIRRRRSPLLPGRQEALLRGPHWPAWTCILHPHPMCHLPRCGNLPSSSIHIAYTNPSLAAISQSPAIACSPIAIPQPLPSPSPTRHALHSPQGPCLHALHRTSHTRPRPFAMPCNPPRPLLDETAFCPLPRSLLHIPRPTEHIAPHRDRQVPSPSPHNRPSAHPQTYAPTSSLFHNTHVRTPPPARLATYQACVTQSPPRARCSAYPLT